MRIVEGRAEIESVDGFLDRLASIGEEHGTAIQAFDARLVAGREHLRVAVERANRAFERGEAIAEDRAIEILLYAAGRRQIDRALAMGVEAGESPVAVVIDGGDEAGAAEAIEAVIDPEPVIGPARDDERIRSFFGIGDAELAATDAGLEALVVERVAMLAVER